MSLVLTWALCTALTCDDFYQGVAPVPTGVTGGVVLATNMALNTTTVHARLTVPAVLLNQGGFFHVCVAHLSSYDLASDALWVAGAGGCSRATVYIFFVESSLRSTWNSVVSLSPVLCRRHFVDQ